MKEIESETSSIVIEGIEGKPHESGERAREFNDTHLDQKSFLLRNSNPSEIQHRRERMIRGQAASKQSAIFYRRRK